MIPHILCMSLLHIVRCSRSVLIAVAIFYVDRLRDIVFTKITSDQHVCL